MRSTLLGYFTTEEKIREINYSNYCSVRKREREGGRKNYMVRPWKIARRRIKLKR